MTPTSTRMRAIPGPLVAAVILTGAIGVVYGVYTDRWGTSGQLEQAVAALAKTPTRFGDWNGEDVPHDTEGWAEAGIKGSVYRKYENTRTGESVSVLIVCGRGGPITVHTPDVCYGGSGYRIVAPERLEKVEVAEGGQHSFKVARFAMPNDLVPTQLEIYWAWSRDGIAWQAPDNPRLSMARFPALYKMYVVREFAPRSPAAEVDSCRNFLHRAIPDLQQALAPEAASNNEERPATKE